MDPATREGLVVGVEGAWGSGKSSLVSLIRDELAKLPAEKRPSIVDFRPWLIGDRDALIGSLFGEIDKKLQELAKRERSRKAEIARRARETSAALRRFARVVSPAGSAITLAGDASGVKPITWLGKAVTAAGGLLGNGPDQPSLSEQKGKLTGLLRRLDHRFRGFE